MFTLLRNNRNLRLLFIAQIISYLGDWFTFVALAGLVQDATGSKLLVSMVLVALSLPSFVMSPAAGSVADRFDRRRILVSVSLAQAVFAVTLLAAGHGRIWIVFVSQSLISALAAFVNPAIGAAVPNLAKDDDELKTANAVFGSSWGVMLAVGASLGGAFSAAFGRNAAFVADAVSFVVAAGLVLLVTGPMQKERTAEQIAEQSKRVHPIDDMREALSHARRDPVLLALMTSKATFAIGTGIVSQLTVLASDVFHGGDGARGLVLGARGVGAALGPIIAARYVGRNLSRIVLLCGVAGIAFAFCYIGAAWSPTLLVATLFIGVAHVGGGANWTLSTYGLQLRADDAILGRILAGDYALFTLILAIASALAGVASEQLGVRAAITVFAVAAGAAATVYLVLTQRVRRSLQVTAAS
ncbi:MAG TPA: MFS transporter [Ilumatobacteraceae bacterium]